MLKCIYSFFYGVTTNEKEIEKRQNDPKHKRDVMRLKMTLRNAVIK